MISCRSPSPDVSTGDGAGAANGVSSVVDVCCSERRDALSVATSSTTSDGRQEQVSTGSASKRSRLELHNGTAPLPAQLAAGDASRVDSPHTFDPLKKQQLKRIVCLLEYTLGHLQIYPLFHFTRLHISPDYTFHPLTHFTRLHIRLPISPVEYIY